MHMDPNTSSFRITPYNAQHIGSREDQQDYFSFSDVFNNDEFYDIGVIAVIADGMGGLENGRQASHIATNTFLDAYKANPEGLESIPERLVYSVHQANAAVQNLEGAGTTMCVAVVQDNFLHTLSVGDSRIYLYRNDTLTKINTEHKYENVLNERVIKGEISLAAAINDPHISALTSYVGIAQLEEIDLKEPIRLNQGDTILLCTDGLYRALTDDEIRFVIRDFRNDACEMLVDKAISKNLVNQDNTTAIILNID